VPSIAQLRYILAVHRHGHFGRAAEAVHVSQPTLSAQIQKAEDELGLTIFVRQNKPITATEKGYALIEQAQVVVAAHERLVRLAEGKFQSLAGDLALGIIPTLAPYVIPWFLTEFAERYPQIQLNVMERTTDDVILGLQQRRIDVGMVATPLDEQRIKERMLFHDPFYLYAHADDPILEQDEVDPRSLEEDRLWLLEDGHCVRNQTMSLCDVTGGCGHLQSVRFEAGSFETLRNLVDASGGYTLFPETYARLLPRDRRRSQIRPFSEPTPTRAIGLVHLRSNWKLDLIDALEASILANVPRALRQAPEVAEVLPVRKPEPIKGRKKRKKKRAS
jgi:LysR family hydrogen peroxide-inducible transcriptional activator